MLPLLTVETFGELASRWLPMLLDASLKGFVILALAGTVTLLMRRALPATRHLVWLLALAGLLVLPVLSVSLPGWQVLPSWTKLPSQVAPQTLTGDTAAVIRPPQVGQPMADDVTAGPAVAPSLAVDAGSLSHQIGPRFAPTESPPTTAGSGRLAAVVPVITAVWLLGMLASLAPLLIGRLSLWHLRRTSRQITDGSWMILLRRACGELRLDRSVVLLASGRRSMPMVWGIFKPKLLLPSDTSAWSAQRRWVVLLHELSHAKRWDCLSKLICQIVCSIYWFNPLVWVAFKKLQAEGERACDDLVLNAGNKPGDYAGHILQIASGLESKLFAAHSGIAMARPSKLEGRLLAILDTKRNRRTLTRIGILAAALLVAALVGITATMKSIAASSADTSHSSDVPEEAVVIDPNLPWHSTSWAGYDDTPLVTMEEQEDYPRFIVAQPGQGHVWHYRLLPFDPQQYPIAEANRQWQRVCFV